MDCRFDIGDEGVHPLERTDLAGSARADDDRSVFGHTGPGGIEAGQPVGDQVNTLVQGRRGPFGQGGPFEVINGIESDMLGIPLVIEFHRRNEPGLVLGTTSRLTRPDATQIGVVGHHHAIKNTVGLALGHRFEQLVLDPPSGAVRHTDVAFQRKCGEVVLVLRHQVHCLKPLGQRDLRRMKHRAGAQCRLCVALRALPVLAFVDQKRGMLPVATMRAYEARRPTGVFKGRFALRLGAIPFDERAQRHAGLKLDRVLMLRKILSEGGGSILRPLGAQSGRPELCFDTNHLDKSPRFCVTKVLPRATCPSPLWIWRSIYSKSRYCRQGKAPSLRRVGNPTSRFPANTAEVSRTEVRLGRAALPAHSKTDVICRSPSGYGAPHLNDRLASQGARLTRPT